jgi:hypothetical protein
MIRYWYDTEFLETGSSIDLISIGIVSSDGRELYAVNREINDGGLYGKIRRHAWLMDNVVRHLPMQPDLFRTVPTDGPLEARCGRYELDFDDPAVMSREMIADEVRDFLLKPGEPMELWAYYGAYDHVVVSWLWGPMINRPKGIPMFSHDICQLASLLGVDDANLPQQTGQLHNALDDARWTRDAWRHLTGHARRHFKLEMADDA